MRPLPKVFGWLGALGAVFVSAKIAYTTGDYTALIAALGALGALFSSSATGDGGFLTRNK